MAFALGHGASPVFLPFLVLEIAWGVVQGIAVFPVLRGHRVATIPR
jgi:hypothetical protein